MLQPFVRGAAEHVVAAPELADVAESLERLRVHDGEEVGADADWCSKKTRWRERKRGGGGGEQRETEETRVLA
jgi:hypothetical protein